MKRFFQMDMDNPIFQVISTIGNVIILNVVYVLCCIPIVTIGAATTALYSISFKLVQKEEGHIVRGFLISFRSNFKQATLLWGILFPVGLILLGDLYQSSLHGQTYMDVLYVVFLILSFFYILLLTYAFPLESKFENSIRNTIKNAFFLGIRNLFPWSLLMALLNVFPILLLWFRTDLYIRVLPIMLFCGQGAIAFVNSKILRRIFNQYL